MNALDDDKTFPCAPTKLLGALAGLGPSQQLVYMIVLLRIYEGRAPCPDSLSAIARRCGFNKRITSDALDALLRAGKLRRVADGLTNDQAERIIGDLRKNRETLSEAGRKGANRAAEIRKTNQPEASGLAPSRHSAPSPRVESLREEEVEYILPLETDSPSKSDWPADYREQFWRLCPRRVEKKAALAKLDTIKKSGTVPWRVFEAGLRRWADAMRSKEQRYIKHPTTWLNKGCWDDEAPTPDGPGGGERKPAAGNGMAALARRLNQSAHSQEENDGWRDDGINDQGTLPSGSRH